LDEFLRHVPSAVTYVRRDELKASAGKVFLRLRREAIDVLESSASDSRSPDEAACDKEMLEILARLISEIPANSQAPLQWLIAEKLGGTASDRKALDVPEATWRRWLNAAKEYAKKRLEEKGYEA